MHRDCLDANGRPTRSFTRKADVARHYKSNHEKQYIDCPRSRCNRKGSNGFTRMDHLKEHLRGYHGDPVLKPGPIASTNSSGETHLPNARFSEQTLVSASSLSDVGKDSLATVDISKLITVKVLDKRSSSSGVEYKCELEPLWLAADLAERAQMGRVHIRSYENRRGKNIRESEAVVGIE